MTKLDVKHPQAKADRQPLFASPHHCITCVSEPPISFSLTKVSPATLLNPVLETLCPGPYMYLIKIWSKFVDDIVGFNYMAHEVLDVLGASVLHCMWPHYTTFLNIIQSDSLQ